MENRVEIQSYICEVKLMRVGDRLREMRWKELWISWTSNLGDLVKRLEEE